jgi:hypothetical protein
MRRRTQACILRVDPPQTRVAASQQLAADRAQSGCNTRTSQLRNEGIDRGRSDLYSTN